ncbi:MAG: RNA-guided endonuclease InsQ/TnpB family protein [Thermoplasmatota archaeon]
MYKTLRQNMHNLDKQEFEILTSLCHLSKNVYNETLYEIRQHFFDSGKTLTYHELCKIIGKKSENYKMMISQAAQQTMKKVHEAFKSFFKLNEKKKKGGYDDKVHIPGYQDKDGFYILDFHNQAFQLRDDHIRIGITKSFRDEFNISKKEIIIPFKYDDITNDNIKRFQIIPKGKGNYLEYRVVYEAEEEPIETDKDSFLSIDLGVNNLATCVDHSGRSFIIDGCKLKSINRWYNKEIARLKSIKDKQGIEEDTKRISKLFQDRSNRIHDYMNKTVHKIIEYCKEHNIGEIVVGDSKGWKQEINIGKRNNQNFVHIPFDKLKTKLKHKCEYHDIDFTLVPEHHTSKCSFLDNEPIKHHEEYVGTRVQRGLFKSKNGTLINADINGALNIAKKAGKLETISGLESSGTVAVPERIRVH